MRRLVHIAALGVLAAAAAVGCARDRSTDRVQNDGRVCLFNASGSPSDGLDSGSAMARVYFNACLSGTCDEVRSKECSATLEGSTVSIESEAVIQRDSGECSDDCGLVQTDCQVGELDARTYTLEHGDESFEFSVPSDESVCDGGSSPAGRPDG